MSTEIERPILEGEVMFNSTEDWLRATVTAEDLARMDETIAKLNKLCARLGVPVSSTIIDSSVAEPMSDPTRLLGHEKA